MSAPGPAFGQAVVHHREAASHLAAAYHLAATRPVDGADGQAQLVRLPDIAAQLSVQSTALAQLAGQYGVAAPSFDNVPPSAVNDFADAVTRAADGAAHAEASLRAAQREFLPVLLPTASPTVRTLAVYGGWSLIGWFVQLALLLVTGGTDAAALLTSLCGMPVLAFGAGFVTLHTLGQPRIGPRANHSIRLGALICFLGMPLSWIALVIALSIV